MEQEIELKLEVMRSDVDPVSELQSRLAEHYSEAAIDAPLDLFNVYYDTDEQQLRQWDMGLRIRGCNDQFEQTLKTSGSELGGVHQRPEYNMDVTEPKPNLHLLDTDIFPEGTDIDALEQQLKPLFTTHFTRHACRLTVESAEIELVIDKGQVEANGHTSVINELELELKHGDIDGLFTLTRQLMEWLPVRVGTQSKAARGYRLAQGQELSVRPPLGVVSLDTDATIEAASIACLGQGLNQWQYHEQCYLETGSIKALRELQRGLYRTSQAINLYLPALQCQSLLEAQQQLVRVMDDWCWVDNLMAIKALRSKKGPFRKKISHDSGLLSYFKGRHEGLMREQDPQQRILSPANVAVQMQLTELLHQRPWRQESTPWDAKVRDHAQGWLAQAWYGASRAISGPHTFTPEQYMASETVLRQTLYSGFFLGDLFSEEERHQFIAPWLDLLDGIDELKVFTLLNNELDSAKVDDKDALQHAVARKQQHLLAVMEHSREEAQRNPNESGITQGD